MAGWLFFTNHLHVLSVVAQQPDLRLREIARQVGITERAAHRIISELAEDGYLTRQRVGSRNHYEVHPEATLRHPVHAGRTTGEIIRLLTTDKEMAAPVGAASIGAETDIFHRAFAAAPAGTVIVDATGRLLAVNQALAEILGYREGELEGRSFRDLTHPEELATDESALLELAEGRRAEYVRETRYLRRDGAAVWVKLRASGTTSSHGDGRLIIAQIVDITERKRHEHMLSEAEERFRSVFDNAPIGMALLAPDGRWIKVNRSLCELTGYTETALLVRTFQSITHPDDMDADLVYLQELLAGKRRTYKTEKRCFRADGQLVRVMLSISLVRGSSGEPLYFIAQIEDISERAQGETAAVEPPLAAAAS